MSLAITDPFVPDTSALLKRIDELETVMRIVLEQIDTYQIYDTDARTLVRRTLSKSGHVAETRPAAVRSASEFPSMFPSAAPRSSFV